MSEILSLLGVTSRVIVEQVVWAALAGSAFICVLWIACRTMPRLLSPGLTSTLWWLACLKLVLDLVWFAPVPLRVLPAPAVTDFQQRSVGQRAPDPAPLLADSTSVAVVQNHEVPTANVDAVGVVIGAAALFWFSGAVLSFGILIRRARQQAAILRKSKPLDDEPTKRTVANIAARLGLRAIPPVRVTDEIESPFVTGLTRPTLLLPLALWTRLTDAQREIAICHECAHIQRRDLFMRWIPMLAERLFFFLPLARLAAREYVLCNEAACDARVLKVLPATPLEYGKVLLAFGASTHHAAVLAVGSSSFASLKRRIAMLAVPSTSSVASRLLAVALVVVAIAVLAPVRPAARSTTWGAPAQALATTVAPATQSTVSAVAAEKGVEVTARDQQAKANVSEQTKVAQPALQKATPVPSTESVPNNSEIQDLEATLKELRAQDVQLALTLRPEHPDRVMVAAAIRRAEYRLRFLQSTGEERAKLVAEEKRMMETMNRMREPPVIDPDAPTVTVVDFDKTATYDQPMHFRVIVTGSVPGTDTHHRAASDRIARNAFLQPVLTDRGLQLVIQGR